MTSGMTAAMPTAYRSIDWDEVEEGGALPPISYELSLLRLVAFVRATGLFDYIHFDRDYAQSIGMRDAFMATPHIVGLFSRLMTDWSGPDADIRSLTLNLNAPSCSGDVLTVSGRVGRKYRGEDGAYLVDIVDLTIAHDHAPVAVSGWATMAFPSRAAGVAAARAGAPRDAPTVAGPDVPAFARPLIGSTRDGPHTGHTALTEREIHLWCECLEDWNPLYWDADYARASRYGGIVAPPGMSWFFGHGTGVSAGVGHDRPGARLPLPVREGLTGLALRRALREGMMIENTPFTLPEHPEAVVRLVHDQFYEALRPGEALRDRFELIDCSPLKRTRLGEGHFITFRHDFRNLRGALVRRLTLSLFHFRP